MRANSTRFYRYILPYSGKGARPTGRWLSTLMSISATILAGLSLSACGDMRTPNDCLISGNQYFVARDYEHAAMDYREALKREPDSAQAAHKTALNNLGVVLNAMERHAEAVEVLRSAVRLDPKNHISRYALAQSLTALKQYEEAVEQAQQAIELSPDELAAHRTLADASLGANQLELAIAQYKYVIKADADDDVAHAKLGEALYKSGDKEAGLAEFKKAIELQPDNVEARKALANALREKGERAAALAEIEEALKHEPQDNELKQIKDSLTAQK